MPTDTRAIKSALQSAKKALTHVTDLAFDEDMAKYNDNGTMTNTSKQAIAQYHKMVAKCAAALKQIEQVSSGVLV